MDRRDFLLTAITCALASGSRADDAPVIDVTKSTRKELVGFLGDNSYFVREAAMHELKKRGLEEIRSTGELLPWKSEILPMKTMSLEVRARLKIILRAVGIEESRLSWRGRRMPEVPGYAHKESVPMIEYFTAVNQALGGAIDIQKLQVESTWRGFKEGNIQPVRTGEFFWEWIKRNPEFTVWDGQSGLYMETRREDKHLSYDGALCGKLSSDKKGAWLSFLTDPGVEFFGYEILSVDAIVKGRKTHLQHDPKANGLHSIYIPYPESLNHEDVSHISVKLRVLGAPVRRATVVDFSEKTEGRLGAFGYNVMPVQEETEPSGEKCYFLPCQISVTGAKAGDPLPNEPKKFFSAYYIGNDGKVNMQYPTDSSSYERMPSGADYSLHLQHRPTRLDIRVSDIAVLSDDEKTLRYDLKSADR